MVLALGYFVVRMKRCSNPFGTHIVIVELGNEIYADYGLLGSMPQPAKMAPHTAG
jgi:hypothetical protein